jgi:8-oxo-dGTP diphosphatase
MNDTEYMTVTAAVIRKDDKVLIAKRKRAFMGSPWEFPGGKAENNETLQECLKRELREEFDIDVEVGDFLCAQKHVLNCQAAIKLYAYEVSHIAGEFQLRDHEEIRWVTLEELHRYNFPDADRMIVKFLLDQPKTGKAVRREK